MLRFDRGRSEGHGAGVRTALGGLRLDAVGHFTDQRGDFSGAR
jgi:hypothetical protein